MLGITVLSSCLRKTAMLMAKFKAVGNERGYPTAGKFGGSCCRLRLKGVVSCLEAWENRI